MLITGNYDHTHRHGTDTTAGYRVVRTDWTNGFPCVRTVVADVNGATGYAEALDLVKRVRATASTTQYGVIDTVYACGCDSGVLSR